MMVRFSRVLKALAYDHNVAVLVSFEMEISPKPFHTISSLRSHAG